MLDSDDFYVNIHERYCVDGTEVLRCRIRIACPYESERIGEFYRELAERAFAFVKARVLPMAESAFCDDADEKKRYRFKPYRYSLLGRVTKQSEESFSICLCASLMRSDGRSESFEDTQTWDISRQIMVPHRQKAVDTADK